MIDFGSENTDRPFLMTAPDFGLISGPMRGRKSDSRFFGKKCDKLEACLVTYQVSVAMYQESVKD